MWGHGFSEAVTRKSFLDPDSGVCVCWLFILKDTEPSPLQDSSSVRQQGGLPGPPPVVPDPESIAAQAAYRGRHSTIGRGF